MLNSVQKYETRYCIMWIEYGKKLDEVMDDVLLKLNMEHR